MTELEQYITSSFGVIETNDLKSIAASFKETTIKKGDFLLEAGRRCDKLCFVQSGIFRMFVSTPQKEVTQWISTKGYFTGDLSSFLFETPAQLSIQALVDSEISIISKEDYTLLGELVPSMRSLFC